MADYYEIAIIGSGPAGLAAAVNAAKHGCSYCLIEKSELANTIHDYQLGKYVMAEPRPLPLRSHIDFAEGSRERVLLTFKRCLEQFGVTAIKGEVTAVRKKSELFHLTYDGAEVTAKYVVLAIGVMGAPRKLGFPGEDAPHVYYTLSDPDAYHGKDIIVVGAGDSAIENALGLMENNSVCLVNRSGEFPRAKNANRERVLAAIRSGKIRCFYDTTIARMTGERCFLNAPSGEVEIKCNHMIIRAGSTPPRRFLESCGVHFPTTDVDSCPAVTDSYQSNVPGMFIIGALIGYPLIKQALNQGHEVVEHILGNPVEPADQVLIADVLKPLGAQTADVLSRVRARLRMFGELSTPQFREMIIDSTVHVLEPGEIVFRKHDHSDTFWSVISGTVGLQAGGDSATRYRIGRGDFFGEMGLISGRRRTATVRALETTVLLETKRNQILKLMASVPSVKHAIDRAFCLRALKTWVFPDAAPALLDETIRKAERVLFQRGSVLFQEGDAADALYVILKGSVKISRKNEEGLDIAQTYLSAGNYVGEMALVSDAPRSATVTAMVACETLRLDKTCFIDLLEKSPETKASVTRNVAERRLENLTAARGQYSGQVLNFVLGEGLSDADNVLLIDTDLCIACGNCESACAATHGGYSRLDRAGGKSFSSIQVPVSCRHCENPLCMLDCPPGALERQVNGEVIINETCIGCGNCVANCPYGVIQLVYDGRRPRAPFLRWLTPNTTEHTGPARAAKCDLCAGLSSGPACVRACATGAALRVNPDQMMKLLIDRRENPAPLPKGFLGYARYRWFWWSALSLLVLWGLYVLDDPIGGPRGGTVLGYSYGGIATACILMLMGYGRRKRSYTAKHTAMKAVLSAHVWLGVLLVFLVPLHSGFSFHWNVHTLAYALLLLTISSGIWGVVMYMQQPRRIYSHHGGGTIAQLLHQIRAVSNDINSLSGIGQSGDGSQRSDAFLLDLLQQTDFAFEPSLWRCLAGKSPAPIDRKRTAELVGKLPQAEREDGLKVVELISRKQGLVCRLRDDVRALTWLRLWLLVHVPVASGLLVALAAHIYSVFYY